MLVFLAYSTWVIEVIYESVETLLISDICDLQLRAFLQSHALPDTQIYAKIENSEVNIMLLRRYCHQFVLMLFWLLRCAFHVRVWIILMTFSKRRMASLFLEETWELTFLQKMYPNFPCIFLPFYPICTYSFMYINDAGVWQLLNNAQYKYKRNSNIMVWNSVIDMLIIPKFK